jgi:hypothetical protein
MNHCTYTNQVWYNTWSWTYVEFLFETLFCLTKLLKMAIMINIEVMFVQTLNQSV